MNKKLNQKGNKTMDQCLNTEDYKLCPELQKARDVRNKIRKIDKKSVDSCISLKELKFKIKPLK